MRYISSTSNEKCDAIYGLFHSLKSYSVVLCLLVVELPDMLWSPWHMSDTESLPDCPIQSDDKGILKYQSQCLLSTEYRVDAKIKLVFHDRNKNIQQYNDASPLFNLLLN